MKDVTKIEVSENELKVLEVLNELTRTHGETCIAFDYILGETKLPLKEIRNACRSLTKKGLAEFYRGLMTEEGEVAGSGYCISYEGQKYLSPCDLCGDLAVFDYYVDENGSQVLSDQGRHLLECEEHYKKSFLAPAPTPLSEQ